jgi:hypothetical protein
MEYSEEVKHNEEEFSKVLATLDPELWRIKQSLQVNEINPMVIPFVIEALSHVANITGHGSITIYISNGEITNIEPAGRMKINLRAVIEGTR